MVAKYLQAILGINSDRSGEPFAISGPDTIKGPLPSLLHSSVSELQASS